jgi:magnesium transporter
MADEQPTFTRASERANGPSSEDTAADESAELPVDAVTDEDAPREVAAKIEEIPAQDGATVLEFFPAARAAAIAEYLDPETAARIVAEMDPTLAASVLTDMESPEASMVIAAMDPDDAVDVLAHIPREKHDEILREMETRQAADMRALELYPPETAGGIMTTEVTALTEDLTVEQAVAELRRLSEQLEQMFYVYVVDRRNHLVGVLSMRDLILARPERRLSKVMNPGVKSVPTTMDREEVSRLFRKYNYLAMPVIDDRNRLVGLITVDDVVRVLEAETTEDMQRMVGAGAEERINSSWHFSFRKRIFWLVVNLGTAFLAAAVVGAYGNVIKAWPVLAAYQTIVSGMGGNAGAQAMAVSIRGIAMGQVDRRQLRRVLRKEAMVGLLSGIVIGILTAGVAFIFEGGTESFVLGLVIGLALILNHVNACVSGVAIPFVMKRLGFDPAQSATIFATTLTDCGGFFATLGLASIAMPYVAKIAS